MYLRIVMQNSTTHVIFDSKEEAMHYTEEELIEYKFSILDEIKSFRRPSSKYEFLLCYPEISDCLHWIQNVSPLDYEEVDILSDIKYVKPVLFDDQYTQFKGLMKSKQNHSLLDGDAYTNDTIGYWQYAVGVKDNYQNNFVLPGPYINGDVIDFHSYILYIRVQLCSFTSKHLIQLYPSILLFIFLWVFE